MIVEQLAVDEQAEGQRLDLFILANMVDYSRSRIQSWIKSGYVTVDGEWARPKDKVKAGSLIDIEVEPVDEQSWEPEAIELNVVYADDDLIVINKPVGLVVHPGAGNRHNTLANGLLAKYPELKHVPRAGIVHRLDKDTSGVMVVARSLAAHKCLVEMIMARELKRQYQAICLGEMIAGGTVDKPIGRHPTKRTLMAVVGNGRESRTHYRVLERFTGVSRLALELDTGRTHQIRVHMSDLGYPLIGDSVYSGRRRTPKGVTPEVRQAIESYGHQALHAVRLAFNHPITGEPLDFEVSLPDDMLSLLKLMRAK